MSDNNDDIDDQEIEETPASKEYWEEFYTNGPGSKQYEWYNIRNEELEQYLLKYVSKDCKILQVGVGNSLVLEILADHPFFPSGVQITNIDISETAIEWMKESSMQQKATKENNNVGSNKKNRLKSDKTVKTPTCTYICMDACCMAEKFQEKFDVIFDKGTLDALLSNGQSEDGTNGKVRKLLQNVHKLLSPKGVFLEVSGNETFVLFPYLYELDWDLEVVQLSKNQSASTAFAGLNTRLYIMKHSQ